MNWIKRNLPLVLCVAAIAISLLAMVISAAISARAQKPEPRQIEDSEVLGVKLDRQRTVLFVVPPDFWAQVEQHCVAVLTEKHDGNLPISFSKGNAVAHIPDKTLKLRCQSEENQ